MAEKPFIAVFGVLAKYITLCILLLIYTEVGMPVSMRIRNQLHDFAETVCLEPMYFAHSGLRMRPKVKPSFWGWLWNGNVYFACDYIIYAIEFRSISQAQRRQHQAIWHKSNIRLLGYICDVTVYFFSSSLGHQITQNAIKRSHFDVPNLKKKKKIKFNLANEWMNSHFIACCGSDISLRSLSIHGFVFFMLFIIFRNASSVLNVALTFDLFI